MDKKQKTVAIVGTTRLSEVEEMDVRHYISFILDKYDKDIKVISGGAVGVDKIAIEIAKSRNLKTEEFLPALSEWKFYKARNLLIVDKCDDIYCLTTNTKDTKCYHHETIQNHQKTAGCWTVKEAKKKGKTWALCVI